jgi:hypothetical protein
MKPDVCGVWALGYIPTLRAFQFSPNPETQAAPGAEYISTLRASLVGWEWNQCLKKNNITDPSMSQADFLCAGFF